MSLTVDRIISMSHAEVTAMVTLAYLADNERDKKSKPGWAFQLSHGRERPVVVAVPSEDRPTRHGRGVHTPLKLR